MSDQVEAGARYPKPRSVRIADDVWASMTTLATLHRRSIAKEIEVALADYARDHAAELKRAARRTA